MRTAGQEQLRKSPRPHLHGVEPIVEVHIGRSRSREVEALAELGDVLLELADLRARDLGELLLGDDQLAVALLRLGKQLLPVALNVCTQAQTDIS